MALVLAGGCSFSSLSNNIKQASMSRCVLGGNAQGLTPPWSPTLASFNISLVKSAVPLLGFARAF